MVKKTSQKKIIIGKQGNKIKEIGIEARKDLEKLLGKKVYLEKNYIPPLNPFS